MPKVERITYYKLTVAERNELLKKAAISLVPTPIIPKGATVHDVEIIDCGVNGLTIKYEVPEQDQ